MTAPGRTDSYDAHGNRTTKTDPAGTTTYTWDAVNRLVQAVVQTATGTTTLTFAYDALGRRVRTAVAQTTGGTTTTRTTDYVYDGEDILLAIETTNGGAPVTTRYVHGPGIDEPLLAEQGGQVLSAHADALGSVTGLSDASQTLAEVSTYTSFGELSRSGTPTRNPYAYTGREWEPELGLYYYRARYYDPEAGRFLSRDPIGFAGGDTNLYGYVLSDPANRVDPMGLFDLKIPGTSGETTVHANPGPEATELRPEHAPDHVHLGSNDGPRVRTDTFEPLTPEDAKRMTRKQGAFCKNLSEKTKGLIRTRQRQIFKYGRLLVPTITGPALNSVHATCQQDPFFCLQLIEDGVLPYD